MANVLYLGKAALVTLQMSLVSIVAATLVGLIMGLAGTMGDRLTRGIVAVYVFLMRGTPVLVQIFLLYFGLPFFGVRVNPYAVAVIAISIHMGALIAEIVRGAIRALPRGQADAGTALGMTEWQVMRLIILPQALRSAFAPYISMLPVTIKATSYASVISIWELTFAAREVNNLTLQPFLIFGVAFSLYMLLCYPLTVLSSHLERRTTAYQV